MAWAKNLGHVSPATTFMVYGGFSPDQQFEVIERLGKKSRATFENQDEVARALQVLSKAVNGKI